MQTEENGWIDRTQAMPGSGVKRYQVRYGPAGAREMIGGIGVDVETGWTHWKPTLVDDGRPVSEKLALERGYVPGERGWGSYHIGWKDAEKHFREVYEVEQSKIQQAYKDGVGVGERETTQRLMNQFAAEKAKANRSGQDALRSTSEAAFDRGHEAGYQDGFADIAKKHLAEMEELKAKLAKVESEVHEKSYQRGLELGRNEIQGEVIGRKRLADLEARLHTTESHPDYDYLTLRGSVSNPNPEPPDGFVPNVEKAGGVTLGRNYAFRHYRRYTPRTDQKRDSITVHYNVKATAGVTQ